MKTTILTSILLLSLSSTFAQQNSTSTATKKNLRLAAALGYATPITSSNVKGGILIALEPMYDLNTTFTLGLRMEGAFKARGVEDADKNAEYTQQLTTSILATGNYHFIKTGHFNPFIGIGAGFYRIAAFEVANGSAKLEGKAHTTFGGMGRLGFEYKHFSFYLEHNLVSKTPTTATNTITKVTSNDITTRNSYLGIKAGFTFGK